VTPDSSEAANDTRADRSAAQPSLWDHMKWSLLMVAVSIVVAALAIPVLRWLGLQSRARPLDAPAPATQVAPR
jgi:hypothetical protein